MAKFWKSPEFKELKSEWDQKLAQDGFEDQEKEVNGELALKIPTSCIGRCGGILRHHRNEIKRNAKITYYELLSKWMHIETDFEDESDRLIMEWTAEGREIKEISIELKRLGMRKSYRNTIRFVRRRYEDKWGIREWKPEEMVSRKIQRR